MLIYKKMMCFLPYRNTLCESAIFSLTFWEVDYDLINENTSRIFSFFLYRISDNIIYIILYIILFSYSKMSQVFTFTEGLDLR